jgi:hypothetical protein
MRVLSFVPALFAERMSSAFSKTETHCAVGSFSRLVSDMEKTSWDAVVFDPDLLDLDEIVQLKTQKTWRAAPLVAYTSLTKASAGKLVGPLSEIVSGLILADYEDSPPRLRMSLCGFSCPVLGFAVLQKLEKKTMCFPSGLRRALFDVFVGANALRSVKEMVAVSGFTRRSVDRWFFRAGLRPGHIMLASANLLRAYAFFLGSQSEIRDVALASGYGSLRALKHNSLLLTGCRPDQLVSQFDPHEIVEVLMTKLLRGLPETSAAKFS